MTDGRVPAFLPYDLSVAKRLQSAFESLRTFGDVATWDRQAQEEIDRMRRTLETLSTTEAQVANVEATAKQAHGEKSFLRRTFTAAPEITAAAKWRKQVEAHRTQLNELMEELEAAIDKTPNSREEQQEMARELKLVKKELSIQKREANEAMRQIRSDARQRSAKVGSGLGMLLSNSKSRRFSRMGIRLEKEARVAPHESLRTQIERQILVVDKAIHWIERFK
jgi:chromosome segregation ATPase